MGEYNDEAYEYEFDSDSDSVDMHEVEVALYSQIHFETQDLQQSDGKRFLLLYLTVHLQKE